MMKMSTYGTQRKPGWVVLHGLAATIAWGSRNAQQRYAVRCKCAVSECICKRHARCTNTVVTSHKQTFKWINQADYYTDTTKQLISPEVDEQEQKVRNFMK